MSEEVKYGGRIVGTENWVLFDREGDKLIPSKDVYSSEFIDAMYEKIEVEVEHNLDYRIGTVYKLKEIE